MASDSKGGGTTYPADLTGAFEEIARLLLVSPTLDEALDRIVRAGVAVIPGCDHAAVSLIEKRNITSASASDDVPLQVDRIQYESDQGPSLDAIREHEIFRTDDLATETRWPGFAKRAAAETGIRSMLCFRLFVREETMGALSLYSKDSSAFGDDSSTIGAVFAAHAAVVMSASREVESLNAALASRASIEQAKGIIMATTRCSADEAFDLLRQQSQALNEKLRDVAAEIVERSTGR